MTALHELTATELLAAYSSRAASPLEATRAVLAQIARWEPRLRATYALDADAALAAARASEQRWLRREPLGALDGVPAMVKENLATRGVASPLGTAATELVPAAQDSPPAARLREAGAVLLGKTTMPDYGMLSSGLSSFHPLTRNPWDLSKGPGGSSSGAGAGAAAGYGPLHLGTDIGGSIRLPAAWCGVVGLKPSNGRVPIVHPYPGRVAGPMTRSVADAALAMQVLAQPDTRDATQLPPQRIAWTALDRDLRGLRIGLWLDAGWGLAVEPETRDAVQAAARAFAAEGAIVEPVAPFTTRSMIDGLDAFWRMRFWLDYRLLPRARQELVLPYIREWIAAADSLSGPEVFRGYSQMAAIRDATLAATSGLDYLLSPVAPVAAFKAEWASPLDDPKRPFEHIEFTLPFNMSEQPAIAVACGHTSEGLPIGLQIAGQRFDDLGVLQLARAWERLRGPQRPWPQPPG